MTFEIRDSSPAAVEAAKAIENTGAKYPFDTLEVGKSFTANIAEVNWKSLRTCVSQRNTRERANVGTGKVFKFIKHDDLGLVEVARLA
ncbi:hypothetical protein [Xanthomonas phage Suba]|uniref:Uncharacterized protein n=1 Tax=Xanthomonas phage Suba TaxID=2674975 RepID=A0A679KES7_9CAUD|nr:hypothetical protein QAY88_gp38 [Xanthomonas phage Suba]CAA2409837.1 hypothetical protein [Xanthomonas phage Suba]